MLYWLRSLCCGCCGCLPPTEDASGPQISGPLGAVHQRTRLNEDGVLEFLEPQEIGERFELVSLANPADTTAGENTAPTQLEPFTNSATVRAYQEGYPGAVAPRTVSAPVSHPALSTPPPFASPAAPRESQSLNQNTNLGESQSFNPNPNIAITAAESDPTMLVQVPSASHLPKGVWSAAMDQSVVDMDVEGKLTTKQIVHELKKQFPELAHHIFQTDDKRDDIRLRLNWLDAQSTPSLFTSKLPEALENLEKNGHIIPPFDPDKYLPNAHATSEAEPSGTRRANTGIRRVTNEGGVDAGLEPSIEGNESATQMTPQIIYHTVRRGQRSNRAANTPSTPTPMGASHGQSRMAATMSTEISNTNLNGIVDHPRSVSSMTQTDRIHAPRARPSSVRVPPAATGNSLPASTSIPSITRRSVRSSTDSNARTASAFQAMAASASPSSIPASSNPGGILERRQRSQLNVDIGAPSPAAEAVPGMENENSIPSSTKPRSLKEKMMAKMGRGISSSS